MQFTLTVTGTLDVQHTLSVLAIHSLPNQEEIDPATASVHRILSFPGELVPARLRLEPEAIHVEAEASHTTQQAIAEKITHWLGLADNPSSAYEQLSSVTTFHEPLRQFPSLRVISYPDPFEAIATTILGQQISLSAARTLATRFVDAVGVKHPGGLRTFPQASATAQLSPAQLQEIIRCPQSRATTLHTAARWYDERGEALLDNSEEFLASFVALKGVGPWTRDYVALRGLRIPEIFLTSDLVVRRALSSLNVAEVSAFSVPAGTGALATVLLWAFDANKK